MLEFAARETVSSIQGKIALAFPDIPHFQRKGFGDERDTYSFRDLSILTDRASGIGPGWISALAASINRTRYGMLHALGIPVELPEQQKTKLERAKDIAKKLLTEDYASAKHPQDHVQNLDVLHVDFDAGKGAVGGDIPLFGITFINVSASRPGAFVLDLANAQTHELSHMAAYSAFEVVTDSSLAEKALVEINSYGGLEKTTWSISTGKKLQEILDHDLFFGESLGEPAKTGGFLEDAMASWDLVRVAQQLADDPNFQNDFTYSASLARRRGLLIPSRAYANWFYGDMNGDVFEAQFPKGALILSKKGKLSNLLTGDTLRHDLVCIQRIARVIGEYLAREEAIELPENRIAREKELVELGRQVLQKSRFEGPDEQGEYEAQKVLHKICPGEAGDKIISELFSVDQHPKSYTKLIKTITVLERNSH